MAKRKNQMPPKAVSQRGKLQDRRPALSSDMRARIGEQLRVMHDDIVKEGVPDRFKDLLRRLDSGDGGDTE